MHCSGNALSIDVYNSTFNLSSDIYWSRSQDRIPARIATLWMEYDIIRGMRATIGNPDIIQLHE